jgi:rhomboid protease GluP
MKLSPDIRIVQTWLSRKPLWRASLIVAWSIFVLILGSVFYWKDIYQATEWMPVFQSAITVKHEYWRLWTALFAHADLGHLLSNSITYFVVGYFLAGYFSLWLFPVLAFAMGGVINYLVVMGYAADTHLIGVSGVVYWMAGAWLVLYFLIDKRKTFAQRALRSMGVALGVFFPAAAFDPSISYKAHLYGFILGVLSGLAYWLINRKTFEKALVYEIRYEEDLETLNSENPEVAVVSDSIN